jgi:hypothetical protein
MSDSESAPGPSPALRLMADRGRLVQFRPLVLAGALLGRSGVVRAVSVWPDPAWPMIAADLADPGPSGWLRTTFEAGDPPTGARARLRSRIGPAGWNALRARGLLLGPPPRSVLEAASRGLGRPLGEPLLAFYSPTGAIGSKASVFVFERGAQGPTALVWGAADPTRAEVLIREGRALERVRAQLAKRPHLSVALPAPPLWSGEVWSERLTVLPPDPLAVATGREDRERSLAWLRGMQEATSSGAREWTAEDERRGLGAIEAAWGLLRPDVAERLKARLGAFLAPLRGQSVERCAVHGDFWRGNIAHQAGQMRVYDWEWSIPDGLPWFDPWTYELGAIRAEAEGDPEGLGTALAAAEPRVVDELSRRGLPSGIARATLCPVLAELALRFRRETGVPGPAEPSYARVMTAAERLLLS